MYEKCVYSVLSSFGKLRISSSAERENPLARGKTL